MKRILILFAFVAFSLSAAAQSPFRGFFHPVTADQLTAYKALTSTLDIRPEFTIPGPWFNAVYVEIKLSAFDASVILLLGFEAD